MPEKPVGQQRRYLAYLLRLWQEGASPGSEALPGSEQGGAPLWRASLERPQSDERRSFGNLADLFNFLEEETGSSSPGVDGPDPEEG